MPKQSQRAFYALRAFNVELASVKGSHNLRRQGQQAGLGGNDDTPSTVALQLRMQWWKDALSEIYGDDTQDESTASPNPALQKKLSISCWNSPIVRALHHAHEQVGFTRRFLDRLIEARAMDMQVEQLATLDESINYAEETVSSLLYLTLESVNVSNIIVFECGACVSFFLLTSCLFMGICLLERTHRFDKMLPTRWLPTLELVWVSQPCYARHPFVLFTTKYPFQANCCDQPFPLSNSLVARRTTHWARRTRRNGMRPWSKWLPRQRRTWTRPRNCKRKCHAPADPFCYPWFRPCNFWNAYNKTSTI